MDYDKLKMQFESKVASKMDENDDDKSEKETVIGFKKEGKFRKIKRDSKITSDSPAEKEKEFSLIPNLKEKDITSKSNGTEKDSDKLLVDKVKFCIGHNLINLTHKWWLFPLIMAETFVPPDFDAIVSAVSSQTNRLYANMGSHIQLSAIQLAVELRNMMQRSWTMAALHILGIPVGESGFVYERTRETVRLNENDVRFLIVKSVLKKSSMTLLSVEVDDRGVSTPSAIADVLMELQIIVLQLRSVVDNEIESLRAFLTYQRLSGEGHAPSEVARQPMMNCDFRIVDQPGVLSTRNSQIEAGFGIYIGVVAQIGETGTSTKVANVGSCIDLIVKAMTFPDVYMAVFHIGEKSFFDSKRTADVDVLSKILSTIVTSATRIPFVNGEHGSYILDDDAVNDIVRDLYKSSEDILSGSTMQGTSTIYGNNFRSNNVDVCLWTVDKVRGTEVNWSIDRSSSNGLVIPTVISKRELGDLIVNVDSVGEIAHYPPSESRYAIFSQRDPVYIVSYLELIAPRILMWVLNANQEMLQMPLRSITLSRFGHMAAHFGLSNAPENLDQFQLYALLARSIVMLALDLVNPDYALAYLARLDLDRAAVTLMDERIR